MSLSLHSLKGVEAKETEAALIETPSELDELFKKYKAVTNADSNGAINVWKDDNGNIHSVAYRYCIEQDYQQHKTIQSAKKWLSHWLEEIK